MTGKHCKKTKSPRPLFAKAGVADAIGLAAVGAGFGAYELKVASQAPASAGVTWLENHGFSHVTRAEDPFISTCGQIRTAHSFIATKDSKETNQTLCFGPFHRITPA